MGKCAKVSVFLFVIVAYNCLFFLTLQWKSGKFEHSESTQCTDGNPCVRFCCSENSSCIEADEIDARDMNAAWDYNATFQVIKERPKCVLFVDEMDFYVISKVRKLLSEMKIHLLNA